MAKAEISWKTKSAEGERREVYVHTVGAEWKFFVREKRYDQWEPLKEPPLEDWLELLDAVQRRVARRLLPPEDEQRVLRRIRQAFPEWKPESGSE
jgi:hypothetical protein